MPDVQNGISKNAIGTKQKVPSTTYAAVAAPAPAASAIKEDFNLVCQQLSDVVMTMC